jgi:hypothetical protein
MMRRAHREWTDRFSEYLSGELADDQRGRLEEHVASCAACRDVLAQLGQVLTLAGEAELLEPTRDLWPGVAAAIGAGVAGNERAGGSGVIALPIVRGIPVGRARASSRVRLATAACLLVLGTAASTWWLTSLDGSSQVVQEAAPSVGPVSDELQASEGLADQLRVLEQLLAAAREALDPSTVLVLERNLNAIEAAIVDSREALTLDPGNGFLAEHLERMYRRKLLYLRDAVRVAEWAG